MTAAATHFVVTELARWDGLAGSGVQALALSFFVDERPLRGATGLADWRLSGRLSRLLQSRRLSGDAGETAMLPPPGARLAFPRLVIFGLGESERFDETRYRRAVRRIRDVLERAGIRRYALQPPGRATGLIAARRALELWLDEAAADGYDTEVTVIESPSGQKEMSEALRSRRPASRSGGSSTPLPGGDPAA
jgi:cytosol aminopeptidase family protein